MAGLDKIKSQILDEAKVTADAKIEDAKAQAEQMKLKAQEEGARQADTILKKSEADTASERACEISHRSSEKNETSGSKAGDDR